MFDKDEQEISQIIEEGIDQLLSGQATLEQILARHPAEADTIRPELETAMWLVERKEQVGPRPGFVMASRKRVVERVKQEAKGQNAKHAFFGFVWPQKLGYQWVAAILIVVLFLSSTSGLVSASQSALPGDDLYSVKRFTEQVSYNMAVDPASRVQLSSQLAERRLDEISALLSKGNFDAVNPALSEFERQVNRTVVLLQGMDTNQNQADKDLAASVQAKLTHNVERLEAMQPDAPAAVLVQLKKAHDITASGAAAAGQVSHGNKPDARFTDTPTLPATLTASPEPLSTPVPAATDTDNDTTVVNTPDTGTGIDLAAQPTPDPGSTISPTDINNPNKNPKSIKSPKPNQSNPNPGNSNPGNSNQGNPDPGKPNDKPPKDNNGNNGNSSGSNSGGSSNNNGNNNNSNNSSSSSGNSGSNGNGNGKNK